MFNHRWAALSGIVFVALMTIGAFLIVDGVPKGDASAQEIARYLGNSDTHTRNLIGAGMWLLGGLAFLGFLSGLRTVLRGAEGDPGTLSNLVFGAGVVFTAVWSVSAATIVSVPYAVEISNVTVHDTTLVTVLPVLGGFMLLIGCGLAAILVLLTTATLIFRTGVLPRWLAWFAIVLSISLVFDVFYSNIVPFLIWVVAASILLLRRQHETATAVDPERRYGHGNPPVALHP